MKRFGVVRSFRGVRDKGTQLRVVGVVVMVRKSVCMGGINAY
jgi:hypothetical protein